MIIGKYFIGEIEDLVVVDQASFAKVRPISLAYCRSGIVGILSNPVSIYDRINIGIMRESRGVLQFLQ